MPEHPRRRREQHWRLLTLCVAAAWASGENAHAGDGGRGEVLFNTTCRVCHGANSHPGREVTRPAANRSDVIASALQDVPDMRPFATLLDATDLEDLAAYFATVFNVPGLPVQLAVEYRHDAFDHYFVTALDAEKHRLDRGDFAGWARTGGAFWVLLSPSHIASRPVCRFFSEAFAPRSSHFYTLLPMECDNVMSNSNWKFEGEVFAAYLPSAEGRCSADQAPIYRLYNNGKDGAPNHRFTPSAADRAAMVALGWTSEGAGSLGVAMCVPNAMGAPTTDPYKKR